MFKKNRFKLPALFLGVLFTLPSTAIEVKEENISSDSIQNKNKSLSDMHARITEMSKEWSDLTVKCYEFKSKFVDIYLDKLLGNISNSEYQEKVNEGKELVSKSFSVEKSLLVLVKEYSDKLNSEIDSARKELVNDSVKDKIKIINKLSILANSKKSMSNFETQISSNLLYLESWLWFADGKFDFPPFDCGKVLMGLEDMQSIAKEYDLSMIDLENAANNLYYIRSICLSYYNDVDHGSIEFNPSIWKSIMEEGEKLLPAIIQLNEQFFDAYSRKYDSIKSDENLQELKSSIYKMVEHFKSNLNYLNKWEDYISENKNAKSLPNPIKEI